jgi:hypothetical protein
MLIVDDILTAPFKGLFWIFNEIRNAALEEQVGEADRITAQLSELYMMLETGRMTEAEFDAKEKALLDRLDAIKEREGGEEEDAEEEMVVIRKRKKVAIPLNFKTKGRSRHSHAEHVLDAIGNGNPGDVVAKAVNNERRLIPGLHPE